MHKQGKWAQEIIAAQDTEGKWGIFHSMAHPSSGKPLTTEQALRRLERLGFTQEDACIQRALSYMHDCLTGAKSIPDPEEQVVDWPCFVDMMLAAWICRFTDGDPQANAVAEAWAEVITSGFAPGYYDEAAYSDAYRRILGLKPGTRMIGPGNFYPVSLAAGRLSAVTQDAFVAHILHHPGGIYYIYDKPLRLLPADFRSREASRYLAAIELLAAFPHGRRHLTFAADWLESHRNSRDAWDMGSAVADRVYFPLADSWRSASTREADCTERIRHLMSLLRG